MTNGSEEHIASIIKVTGFGELGTTLAVTSNRSTLRSALMMEAITSSERPVLTRATQRNILENCILYRHRRENLKTYTEKNMVLGSRNRSVYKADNPTTICEPII
jgi:hypothetical protein